MSDQEQHVPAPEAVEALDEKKNPLARLYDFVKASYVEMTEHVTWPSVKELRNSTLLVLVATAIFTLMIFGTDTLWRELLNLIYGSNN